MVSLTGQELSGLAKRGIAKAAQEMGWQPYKYKGQDGYAYPVLMQDDNQQFRLSEKPLRWKNANSNGKPKYFWPSKKPDNVSSFYYSSRTKEAIQQAGGSVWLVEGEVDLLSMHEAGIYNVITGLCGGNSITTGLAGELRSLGVKEICHLPDLDKTGHESASKVAQLAAEAGIHYIALQLPEELGEKGDVNDLWKHCDFDALCFREVLDSLPEMVIQEDSWQEPVRPLGKQHEQSEWDKLEIPPAFLQAIEQRLGVKGYKQNGWSENVCCPFHEDKNPSAGWNHEKGILRCFSCAPGHDTFYLAKEVGEKFGLRLRDFYPQPEKKTVNNSPSASITHKGTNMANYAKRYVQTILKGEPVDAPDLNKAQKHGEVLNALYNAQQRGGQDAVLEEWSRIVKEQQAARTLNMGDHVLHVSDLSQIPPHDWLIKSLIPKEGLVEIHGAPASGKSLVALHDAAELSRDYTVVYAANEGLSGINNRVKAWEQHYGKKMEKIFFFSREINLLSTDDVDAFVNEIRPLAPDLVIVDTLARGMVGGDENSARDMGIVISHCNSIQKELNTAIVLVHHSGKSGNSERGSSALRGACDVMAEVSNNDGVIEMKCSKIKDGEPFEIRRFAITPVGDSVVAVPTTRGEVYKAEKNNKNLNDLHISILEMINLPIYIDAGARRNAINEYTNKDTKTLDKVLSKLKTLGYIRHSNRGEPYFITKSGIQYLEDLYATQ